MLIYWHFRPPTGPDEITMTLPTFSPWLRALVTLVLLGVVLMAVDRQTIWELWQQTLPGLLLAALALSVVQVVLSAWRWRFTAARLGIHLPMKRAVAEYYLGTLINQILPGGVLGDASRALRHGTGRSALFGDKIKPDSPVPMHKAVHAVVIERLSGQMALFPVVVVSVLFTPAGMTLWRHADSPVDTLQAAAWGLGALLLVAAILGLLFWRAATRLGQDVFQALIRWPAPLWQQGSSLLVVLSYIAIYFLAARALQIDIETLVLLPLIPLVLLSMLVPFTVSGWGVREGTAAALWAMMGLPPAEGVAISVTYGLLILVSSLPGLATPLISRRLPR